MANIRHLNRKRKNQNCPRGYVMDNRGVCKEKSSILSNQAGPGGGGGTREDCYGVCHGWFEGYLNHCMGPSNSPRGGCNCIYICGANPEWAAQGVACYFCSPPSSVFSDFTDCINNCHTQHGGSGIGGSGGRPPIKPPGGWRRGGIVPKKRR
tara:strand:- start:111 stop:566 length:456 start_codon:yes stop_codon:yes gene_type:complete